MKVMLIPAQVRHRVDYTRGTKPSNCHLLTTLSGHCVPELVCQASMLIVYWGEMWIKSVQSLFLFGGVGGGGSEDVQGGGILKTIMNN